MMTRDWIQLGLYVGLLLLLTKPMGLYLEKVFSGSRNLLSPVFGRVERLIYGILGIDPNEEQSWQGYAGSLLAFSVIAFFFTFFILKFQHLLPLNPQHFPGLSTHLAFNTAISFVTNTNWQSYGGESTLSYFSQVVVS